MAGPHDQDPLERKPQDAQDTKERPDPGLEGRLIGESPDEDQSPPYSPPPRNKDHRIFYDPRTRKYRLKHRDKKERQKAKEFFMGFWEEVARRDPEKRHTLTYQDEPSGGLSGHRLDELLHLLDLIGGRLDEPHGYFSDPPFCGQILASVVSRLSKKYGNRSPTVQFLAEHIGGESHLSIVIQNGGVYTNIGYTFKRELANLPTMSENGGAIPAYCQETLNPNSIHSGMIKLRRSTLAEVISKVEAAVLDPNVPQSHARAEYIVSLAAYFPPGNNGRREAGRFNIKFPRLLRESNTFIVTYPKRWAGMQISRSKSRMTPEQELFISYSKSVDEALRPAKHHLRKFLAAYALKVR